MEPTSHRGLMTEPRRGGCEAVHDSEVALSFDLRPFWRRNCSHLVDYATPGILTPTTHCCPSRIPFQVPTTHVWAAETILRNLER
jgi:hypothetical protein